MNTRARARAPELLPSIAAVVWPDPLRVELTRKVSRPAAGTQEFLVLPGVRSPRWLLPTQPRAEALPSPAHRAGLPSPFALLRWAHRTGLLRWLPLWRLRVEPVPGGTSLLDDLSEAVGEPVTAGIRLGSWPHARTIVARLLGADGRLRAYAKVGIDVEGRAAVEAESVALARLAELGLEAVDYPATLHRGRWRDTEVLAVTPLVAGAEGPRRMPREEMRELSAVDGLRRGALRQSAWHIALERGLSDVRDASVRALLEELLQGLLQASEATLIDLGCWHGDWTPWNMSRAGNRVLLWDWEHFATGVPVGMDALHYRAQELRKSGRVGRAAEQTWLSEVPQLLAGHGETRPDVVRQLSVAYLLEVNLRYVLDRQGTVLEGTPRAGWGLDLLSALAGDLDERFRA